MELKDEFKKFCNDIKVTSVEVEKWNKRIKKIAVKLNKKYYEETNCTDHMIHVGSIGRGTAISGVSDWDCIFELPAAIYRKFDNYETNGQSALLQEIKNEIIKTYPKTDIKGDGQVVVISFQDGVIELVPGFKNGEDYKFPDSTDGGKWKVTKPIPEQTESSSMASKTNNHYVNLCQIMRKWKTNTQFKFKGLLIDTLVKDFFDSDKSLYSLNYKDYQTKLTDFFEFLSKLDPEQSYWYALGSNQQITNDDKGVFIKNAKKAYSLLSKVKEDDILEVIQTLIGEDFGGTIEKAPQEELIEHKFEIIEKYSFKLECTIEQDGFRAKSLSTFNLFGWKLKPNKKLTFEVVNINIPRETYNEAKWYWKVRNVGIEAKKREMERGNISLGSNKKIENTSFTGEHYVECYAVTDEVVVAIAKINVPISTLSGTD